MIWATIVMAFREIRRNKLRSMLTTLGIVIGVGSVITMVTLARGATAKITADIAAMGTNLLIVMQGSDRHGPISETAMPLEIDDAKAILREVSVVAAVAPSASRNLLVVYGNKNWNTSITGATNEYFAVRGFVFSKGTTFSDAELQAGGASCVLGATVVKELFGSQEPLGASVRVGNVSCNVTGILEAKGQSTFGRDQDDFVVMPLAAFQRRIAGNNDLGAIFVSAADGRSVNRARAQIEALMRERRRIQPGQTNDFMVQDMKEVASTLGKVTGALTTLLGAIAGVSLLVGGIGIMNIMLVSVTERTREIGVRMAVGATDKDVQLQFLVEAITLSMMGGLAGILVGLIGSTLISKFLSWPTLVSAKAIFSAAIFSGAVGIFFGYYPARKAARLDPIEALRYE